VSGQSVCDGGYQGWYISVVLKRVLKKNQISTSNCLERDGSLKFFHPPTGRREKWREKDKTTVGWRAFEVLKPWSWEPNTEGLKPRSWERACVINGARVCKSGRPGPDRDSRDSENGIRENGIRKKNGIPPSRRPGLARQKLDHLCLCSAVATPELQAHQ